MKVAEVVIDAIMTILGLWLCWCYASEGKAVLSTAWAAIAVLNGSSALLRGAVLCLERD